MYKKQTWNDYDKSQTEDFNLKNGGIITSKKLDYMEQGIEEASKDLSTELNIIGKGLKSTMEIVEEDSNKKIVLNLSEYDDTTILEKIDKLEKSYVFADSNDIDAMFEGTYSND